MNIYSVLDSDDDEKPTKPVVKKNAKETATQSNSSSNVPAKEVAKSEGNKDKSAAKPAKNNTEFEAPPTRENKGPKSHQHQRHGAKNHHGVEGEGEAPRKRQFDRRSGTGRGKEVAKDGAGGANWGNDKLEALKAEKHIAGDAVEASEEVVPTEDTPVVEEPAPEPEPTTFTLDEYTKKRDEAKANNAAFADVQVRKVTDDFSGMKTAEKEQTVFISLGNQKQQKAKKDQRSSKANAVLDVAFTVAPTEPPRNDRDGFKGGRGPRPDSGRGRNNGRSNDRPRSGPGGRDSGRGRGPTRNGPRVDFNDAEAFPSL